MYARTRNHPVIKMRLDRVGTCRSASLSQTSHSSSPFQLSAADCNLQKKTLRAVKGKFPSFFQKITPPPPLCPLIYFIGHRAGAQKTPAKVVSRRVRPTPCKDNVCSRKDSLVISATLRDSHFNSRRSVTILRLAADLGGFQTVRFIGPIR